MGQTSSTPTTPASGLACSVVAPQPSGVVCNVPGVAGTPDASSIFQTDNATVCRDFCLRRYPLNAADPPRGCRSYSWDSSNKNCTLYDRRATSNGQGSFTASSGSSAVFWDATCFSCSGRCPQTNGVNVIDNPGFESSSSNYGPWYYTSSGSGTSMNYGNGRSGRGVSCSLTNTDNSVCAFEQSYNSCPGQMYLVNLDYQLNLLTGPPAFQLFKQNLNIRTSDAASNTMGYSFGSINPTDAAANKWVTLTFGYTANENSGVLRAAFDTGVGTLTIDNANVRPVIPAIGTREFAVNGGFETGNGSDWTATYAVNGVNNGDRATVRSPGLAGSRALFVSSYGATLAQRNLTGTVSGQLYQISFTYRAPDAWNLKGGFYAAAGGAPSTATWYGTLPTTSSTGTKRFAALFVAGGADVPITLDFSRVNTVSTGDLVIDDISVRTATV